MKSIKTEAIQAIDRLPEDTDIEEMMYRLYVIEKVRKGRTAVQNGETVSTDELREEMKTW